MPFYPEEVVEEVRSRSDIVEIIGEHVQLKKQGANYVGLCPFHSEKSASFSVSENKQLFYCFGCQKGGSVFTFLMEYEHMTFGETIEYLADRAGVSLPANELTKEEKAKYDLQGQLKEINHKAVNYFYACLKKDPEQRAHKYFNNRGLTDETIKAFGLGYSQISRDAIYRFLKREGFTDEAIKASGLVIYSDNDVYDKFYNRAMFPILDQRGKTIAFGGRVMGDGKPKYLNSPETPIFSKRRNLFGLYQARTSKRKGFILCEGYLDVITMHQAGFDNAIATLGTAFTEEQAMMIKSRRGESLIYLAYDSDDAGVHAALSAIEICNKVGLLTRVINMKPYKDPDEFINNEGAEEFEKRIEESLDSVMFQIKIEEQKYNLEDPQEKSAFADSICVYIAGLSGNTRGVYESFVCEKYNLDKNELHKAIVKLGENMQMKAQVMDVREKMAKEKADIDEKAKEGDALQEKLLLTWVANHPTVWKSVREYISPGDFINPVAKRVAEIYDEHFEKYGKINFGELIDSFEDVDAHSEVSSIVNQLISYDGEDDPDVKVRVANATAVLSEVVKRVKTASLNRQMEQAGDDDIAFLQKLIKEKKQLPEIKVTVHRDDL